MYCKNCGKSLNQGELFCTNCGTKVETSNNFNQNLNGQMIADNLTNQQTLSDSSMENLNNQINNININQQPQQLEQNVQNKNEQVAINNNMNQQNFQNSIQSNGENQAVNNAFNSQTYYNSKQTKEKSWKNTTSLVIGIISFVLVFIFQIFTMPLSIVGIVFGVLSLKDNKKYKIGLILNIISLVIAIPIFMLYSNLLESKSDKPIIGTWNCKAFNNGNNKNLDYIVTMKLNHDGEFKWNKYNDEKNNYVIGTYEFENLHKTNSNGTTSYYSITLTVDKFVNAGILQTQDYKSEYEMGIIKDADEAILMNTGTYNMYYCHRSDTSSPKIKTDYSNN